MNHRSARRAIAFGAVLAFCTSVVSAREAPKKYLRFAEDGGQRQLQTSIVRFENAAGAEVDLIGAVHIADGPYYDALNGRFKAYDALLYEMVKPKGMRGVAAPPEPGEPPRAGGGWITFIQRFMKDQLELDFQLDRIDYAPANFVHADLDAETFAERQAARGESMFSLMLESMLREMNKAAEGGANGDAMQMGVMDLIQALQAPDRGRQLKLVLGRQFESMDAALDAMGGPDGSVILDERNQAAMKVLKEQLDAGKTNVGIFYGAGHMAGMEKILTKELGFKQVGEPEWLAAWDVSDPAPRPMPKAIAPASERGASPSTRPAPAR